MQSIQHVQIIPFDRRTAWFSYYTFQCIYTGSQPAIGSAGSEFLQGERLPTNSTKVHKSTACGSRANQNKNKNKFSTSSYFLVLKISNQPPPKSSASSIFEISN